VIAPVILSEVERIPLSCLKISPWDSSTSLGMTVFTAAQAIFPRDLRLDPSCIGVALCPNASVTS